MQCAKDDFLLGSMCVYLQCNSGDPVCHYGTSYSSVSLLCGCTVVRQDWTLTWQGQLGCETFSLPTPTSESCYKHWKKIVDHLWLQMGICGRCTSCSHGISRDAQNMSSKLTGQSGEENIILFGYSVSQTYQGEWAPLGSQAHASSFSGHTTALTSSRLHSETQGQCACATIWSTSKWLLLTFCTIWLLLHKIGCDQVVFWVVWCYEHGGNGLCGFDYVGEVSSFFSSFLGFCVCVQPLTYIILQCHA